MAHHANLITMGLAVLALAHSVNGRSAEQRWHPLENYTVEYAMSGSQSGTAIWRSRNWGREQVQENDYVMKMAGMSIPTKNRTINKGREIITIDLIQNTATQTENPMFDSIAAKMKDKDPVEFGKEMMRAFGHQQTDEKKSVAGESCVIWRNTQLGQEVCMTEDGLTLWSSTNMMGMAMTQIATRVDREDSGPDSAYQVPAGMTATQAPNMDDIRKMMRGGK